MVRPWKAASVLAALVACAVSAPKADAGLLPVQVTVMPDAGNFRYTYAVVLTSDSRLEPGDFFTIYDFAGYVDGSATAPSGFTLSTSNTGQTPVGTVPNDNADILNLTWTYDGPSIIAGQVGLGNFIAISVFETTMNSHFTARSHRQVDGQVDSNITETLVPTGLDGGTPPVVPEPATLALVALGLPMVGAVGWVRRRRRGE